LTPGPSPGAALGVVIALLAALLPRIKLPDSIDPEGLSRDPAVVAAYMNDPLVDKRYSARLVHELLGAIRAIEGRGRLVPVPLLVVHGEADPLCPIDGSRRFAGDVPTPGSELKRYPGLRHEVLNEPEREQVLADIATWIEKRVPGRSS
jgi:alpha-beta hydrolase superfamily lysophospholipase